MTAAGKSLEDIYTDFACCLRAFILARVEDEQAAEDILQDVFVRMHAHMAELRDNSRLESWMYQIARNAIIDHYRRKRPLAPLPDDLPEEGGLDDNQPDAAGELAAGLRETVDELPEPYREAVLLVEFQGLSQAELAARLGISLSGAKSRVQRGREKLRDLLLQCCHFEFDRYGRVVDYWALCCCCKPD